MRYGTETRLSPDRVLERARAFFGPVGGGIAAALILVSIVSCLNATILVGPRIAYAMALDGLLFSALDEQPDKASRGTDAAADQGSQRTAELGTDPRFALRAQGVFSNYRRQHVLVQAEIRDQLLQPRVLLRSCLTSCASLTSRPPYFDRQA